MTNLADLAAEVPWQAREARLPASAQTMCNKSTGAPEL